MKLPRAKRSDNLTKKTQLAFGGYDALGTEGAIRDMKNLSADYAPELAVRNKRRYDTLVELADPRALGPEGDSICWLNGRQFYYWKGSGGYRGGGRLMDEASDAMIAQLGDYITIWPKSGAAKYYDMGRAAEHDIVSYAGGSLGLTLEAEWFLFEKSGDGGWNSVTVAHAAGAELPRAGDAVKITCRCVPELTKTVILRSAESLSDTQTKYLCDDECFVPGEKIVIHLAAGSTLAAGDWYVYMADRAYALLLPELPALTGPAEITIEPSDWDDAWGRPVTAHTSWGEEIRAEIQSFGPSQSGITWLNDQTGVSVYVRDESTADSFYDWGTMAREIPAADIVFAHENRLFALKGDTLYISKLGDPFNWFSYDGTAMDSYAVETGTPGAFTGGISFGGCPRLFKEDRVFTLYGDYPAEYQLAEKRLPGVMEGSEKSLAIGGGKLFYLSPQGVMMYTGAGAVSLAAAFGVDRYKNGVGASDDEKYYLCMTDRETEERAVFVYDIAGGLWMKEDEKDILFMARHGGAVWSIAEDGILTVHGRPARLPSWYREEDELSWYAEFGDIAEQAPEKKRIVKLLLRLELEDGAQAAVKLQYDSDGIWRRAGAIWPGKKRSVVLPLVPRRYDHLRLRIEGTGMCRISSLSLETAAGSDRT